jgi:hypothetical protein
MFHFVTESSNDTLSSRGIFNLRDESLARPGCYRLHVIACSTLASELGLLLSVGFTALVVRVVELGGERIADHLRLADPVAALRQVAGDPACKERLHLAKGGYATAIEVQNGYLELVRRYLPQLPEWAPDVCDRLEKVLSALADDPALMSGTLDWAIKHAIYSRQPKDSKDEGSDLLAELYSALRSTAYGETRPPLEVLLGPSSPVLATVARLNEQLVRRKLEWQALKPHDSARMRMAEIDTRFGILGDGIFDQLDRQGLLRHRLVSDDQIERASSSPPADTRARLRGRAVKHFAGRSDVFCSWCGVYDKSKNRVLDLRDPWQTEEHWMPIAKFEAGDIPNDAEAILLGLGERIP